MALQRTDCELNIRHLVGGKTKKSSEKVCILFTKNGLSLYFTNMARRHVRPGFYLPGISSEVIKKTNSTTHALLYKCTISKKLGPRNILEHREAHFYTITNVGLRLREPTFSRKVESFQRLGSNHRLDFPIFRILCSTFGPKVGLLSRNLTLC